MACSVSPRMNHIALRDQFKKIRTFLSCELYRVIEILLKVWENSKKPLPLGSCSHSVSSYSKLPFAFQLDSELEVSMR